MDGGGRSELHRSWRTRRFEVSATTTTGEAGGGEAIGEEENSVRSVDDGGVEPVAGGDAAAASIISGTITLIMAVQAPPLPLGAATDDVDVVPHAVETKTAAAANSRRPSIAHKCGEPSDLAPKILAPEPPPPPPAATALIAPRVTSAADGNTAARHSDAQAEVLT